MAEYQLVSTQPGATEVVQRTSDGAFIPADPANADWAEYQAWVEAGGVPDAAVQPEATERGGKHAPSRRERTP